MTNWNVTFDENSFQSANLNLDSTTDNINPSQQNRSLKELLINAVQSAGNDGAII